MKTNMTEKQVLKALRTVNDPDLHKDLVSLRMIDDIKIEGNKIHFNLLLTTPACPLKEQIKQDCIHAIHRHLGKDVQVDIDFSSHVTTRRKEHEELLKDVKNIIAVGSGKGGVGKSTVAVNLAVALAKTGTGVGLIDAYIYGPSIPMMFGLLNRHPGGFEKDGKTRIMPFEKYGLKLISIGFFVDQSKALIWRGPMASTALKQLITDVEWGTLDYMIIDLPPGTGDIPLTLIQSFPLTGAIIVSTPQQLAIADVRKAADMFRNDQIRIPVLGLVENMSYFIPPEMPGKKYFIFGKEGCRTFAAALKIPLLGEIPIVPEITDSGDKGIPVATEDDTPVSAAFKALAGNVAQQIAITNAIKSVFGSRS